jgi:CDP-paratose 2-epimerase
MKMVVRPRGREAGRVLVTGGAGFIGTNLAHRLLQSGRRVTLLDNLSRPGVEANVRWLSQAHGSRLRVEVGDVRRPDAVAAAMRGATQVFHFAAQVAVTTSIDDPLADFETNARGTVNVLEAARAQAAVPSIVFTSTNKVYGACDDVPLAESATRYEPRDRRLRGTGTDESRPLDFHSPYGCSKGAADQYVLDYARTYAVPAVVFRMSCIYGPHQFGTEDQGWVAHFLIRAIEGRPLTIYGDGKQVRDVLFVEDLVDAFLLAQAGAETLSGRAFNVGGGPGNTISLLELLDLVREMHGSLPPVSFAGWRTGDQRHYVSDTRQLQAATGWSPRTGVREGTRALYDWLLASRGRRARAGFAAGARAESPAERSAWRDRASAERP